MASPDDYRGNTIPPLTLWQKINIAPLLLVLPLAVVIGVFRENKGRSWRRAARIAAVRHVLGGRAWTPWELKSAAGATTAQAYATWARKTGAEVLTDELPEGAKLHWIGPRRMDRVLLYLHGGGYMFPARNDYFDLLASLQKEYDGAVGIAMLHYSLAPEYPFPTQLRQAFAAIKHLLDEGLSPSNIIIAGDSAGGNLVLQVASQLLHPHPLLPTAPTLQEPFGGMLLISPWTEFSTDAPSFARNGTRDFVPVCIYQLAEAAVRPGVTPALQHHLEPGLAPRGWWNGLDRVFGRVLITAGEHEALIDQIQAAAAAIAEDGVSDTTMFALAGGVHEDFVEAFGSGEGGRGLDYKIAVTWVSGALRL